MPKGNCVYTLRRGFLNSRIMSIVFNSNSTLIGATSSRGTLHIFELERTSQQSAQTAAPDVEDQIELREKEEPEVDTQGCSTCLALRFLFEKFTSMFCCAEHGRFPAGLFASYIHSKICNQTPG